MAKKPTDDMLRTLADLEWVVEVSKNDKIANRNVTMYRQLLREAGYEIPVDYSMFDWIADD